MPIAPRLNFHPHAHKELSKLPAVRLSSIEPTALESTNGEKRNKRMFITDAIADAEIADSRNSNGDIHWLS